MTLNYSFIIPVFNRPDETEELLQSLSELHFTNPFEVIIVEDGSKLDSKHIIDKYQNKLQIKYFYKSNSGPGDSRNYGMQRANGNYFIILDSDCILPPNYLQVVDDYLTKEYFHCFGGPDVAHDTFTPIQKAINFSMTSFLTTGGIRGGNKSFDKFQPRSFNMGLSKEAFEMTNGFGSIHPGEDPDLTLRLWELNFKTALFPMAYVYHKRRISWKKFHQQVIKFGLVRPILNSWHPKSKKITYWFPTLFILGLFIALILILFKSYLLIFLYLLYFSLSFTLALVETKNIKVAALSIWAILIQFYGYGFAFLKSTVIVDMLKQDPRQAFPNLFFEK